MRDDGDDGRRRRRKWRDVMVVGRGMFPRGSYGWLENKSVREEEYQPIRVRVGPP